MTESNKQSTYAFLINILQIDEQHRKKLHARGLSDEQIDLLQYKTHPIRRSGIVEKCAAQVSLEGVPGFWKNSNGKWQLAGKSGLMIPVRNFDGSIESLKIRADDRESVGKYLQLSSNPKPNKDGDVKYPNGAAATISVHFPIVGKRGETIRITEGELKADIATLMSDVYTISIPGIAMWQWAIKAVEELKPKKILLAFDSDKNKEFSTSTSPETKPFAVAKALANLHLSLREKGYNVAIEDWSPEIGKGIDDVLMAGLSDQITEMSDEKAQEFITQALKDDMPMNWVYVIGTKRFFDFSTHQELDKEQFSDKFAADFKKGKASDKVIRNPGFPKVDLPTYEPGLQPIIEKNSLRYFNLWRPCTLKPECGDVGPFIKHCEYILPDKSEREIMYDFLAHNIQNPGSKIHWALLLQGVQGTGKSYFGEVMRKCLGQHNVSNPSNEAIHEAFTGWQKSCQLVVIEELMARGRLELMNKLKPMITQTIAVIREMYKPPYEQPNKFNLLMFTNHEDAIIVDETDRRYCVLYSDAKPLEAEYYTNLWLWTERHAGRILHWLNERDISQFHPKGHAPMTEGKRKLIKESAPPLLAWIKESIETQTWPMQGDIVAANHLADCLPNHLRGTHPSAISKALKQAGARPLKQVRLSTGNYARLVSIRRHEMVNSASDETLVAQYEQWSMSREPGGNPLLESKPF